MMWEWEQEQEQHQFHDNHNTSQKPDQIPDPNSYLNFDFLSSLSKPKVPKTLILFKLFYEYNN